MKSSWGGFTCCLREGERERGEGIKKKQKESCCIPYSNTITIDVTDLEIYYYLLLFMTEGNSYTKMTNWIGGDVGV